MDMHSRVWSCVVLQVGIIGASGYTGAELLRLCAQHPHLEVALATGDSQAGVAASTLYPSLAAAYPDLVFQAVEPDVAAGLDVVFLCLPHEASMAVAPRLVGSARCVIDLSAAYRLQDASLYPQWYGFHHDQPELLAEAVYGLPERHRTAIEGARLVATPGCHVTAATLAIAPLVDAGLIEPDAVVVNSITGVSGAGRAPKHTNAFCTVDEDVQAYGLLDHRHTPEIEQETGARVLFTPHLAPMNRGILATCTGRSRGGATTDDVLEALTEAYRGEPFVVVRPDSPSTKATLGANTAHVTARVDPRTGTVLAICAIDNLAKGASGGAVQAANVAMGLPETAGLSSVGVYP